MKTLYLESVDSTNKWVKDHIGKLDDMTLVYTYNQTNGRGRLNRIWNYTGKDNIYASILLKPSGAIGEVYSNLTQYLCIVLINTLEEYNIFPKIKWPNDILVNGKKISGILAESIGLKSNGTADGIVIGFGVNLNTTTEVLNKINQPATSLNIEIGKTVDKELFLKKVNDKFCLMYHRFIDEGFLLIREEYLQKSAFINSNISVKVFDKIISGRVTGLTDDGALKIVDNNNKEQILLIGDIL